MSTRDEFDYEGHYRTTAPESANLTPSIAARDERRRAAKHRITIRLDQDVIDQFRHLADSEGGSYQALINIALREWLTAQDVKALLSRDLPQVLRDALAEGVRQHEAS